MVRRCLVFLGVLIAVVSAPVFASEVCVAKINGVIDPINADFVKRSIAEAESTGAEALILGCTHYPLLVPSLRRVAGPDVVLVDSASAVAEAVAATPGAVVEGAPRDDPRIFIHLTDASDHFLGVARRILGAPPRDLQVVHLGGE